MGVPVPIRLETWSSIADSQDGIVSRRQLLALGLSSGTIRTQIDSQRWRVLLPGIYATFTGPVSAHARIWSAVLYAGTGAAASHRTALWLGGLFDESVDPVHVSIPASRRVIRQPGIRVHLSHALDSDLSILHPSATPPRIRLESALLDQCEHECADQTTHLVLSAIQRRLTTAARIRAVIQSRTRHRWRALISEMLDEAREGVASPLELRFRRNVELRHRLPAGLRNRAEHAPTGGNWYRDVRYPRWRVIVELDGRAAHPADRAFRDLRRDNVAAVAGDSVLRYGWRDVVGDPCKVALQVSAVLTLRGWTGELRRCGATCSVVP